MNFIKLTKLVGYGDEENGAPSSTIANVAGVNNGPSGENTLTTAAMNRLNHNHALGSAGANHTSQQKDKYYYVNKDQRGNGPVRANVKNSSSGLSISIPVLHTKIQPDDGKHFATSELNNHPKVANSCELTPSNIYSGSNNVNTQNWKQEDSRIPKPLQKSIVPENPPRRRSVSVGRVPSSSGGSVKDTKFETVVVSKGVTMKRVQAKVDISSNNKATTVTNPKSPHRRKSVSATGKSVKEKGSAEPSNSSKNNIKRKSVALDLLNSNNNASSNSKVSSKNSKPNKVKVKSVSHSSRSDGLSLDIRSKNQQPKIDQEKSSTALDTNLPTAAVESYKTLQEFLDMPTMFPDTGLATPNQSKKQTATESESELPSDKLEFDRKETSKSAKSISSTVTGKLQGNTNSTSELVKPPYYKSKFWDYIGGSRKDQDSSKQQEKTKNYDPTEVKQFMKKQNELLKQRNLEEYKAREQELQKKKQRLRELDEKCRDLANKASQSARSGKPSSSVVPPSTPTLPGQSLSSPDHLNFKEMRSELEKIVENSIPEKLKSKSPGLESDKSTINTGFSHTYTRKSRNTTILLEEFESIVKRECINFFEARKKEMPRGGESLSLCKLNVDKCVETTDSLLEDLNHSKSSSISSTSTVISMRNTLNNVHSAASKIQAAFKGYKERKILKEANLLPKDLVKRRHCFQIPAIPTKKVFRHPQQKTPERPYDNDSKDFSAPIQRKCKSLSTNSSSSGSPYIPPVHRSSQSQLVPSKVSNRPHLLNASLGTSSPVRLSKSFNEPYPKEAIQKIQEAQAQQAEVSLSRRNSMSDILKVGVLPTCLPDSHSRRTSIGGAGVSANQATIGSGEMPVSISQSPNVVLNARRKSDIGVRTPSIAAALFEKLRILENDKKLEQSNAINDGADMGSERNFGSISSITRGSYSNDSQPASHDITFTDDASTDSDIRKTSTPIIQNKKLKSDRIKTTAATSPSSNSTESASAATTVDTDADLMGKQPHQKKTFKFKIPKEDLQLSSSQKVYLSSSSTTADFTTPFPVPAFTLQYQAEQERLNILDKALKTTIQLESQKDKNYQRDDIIAIAKAAAEQEVRTKLAQIESQKIQEQLSKLQRDPTYDKTQLEIMKCHQAAVNSTAEFSKWMAEMQRSHLKEAEMQSAQRPRDIATIVYAAVDEAKKFYEENRQLRKEQEEKEKIIIYRASEQTQVYPTNTNDDDSIGLTSVNLPLRLYDDAVKLLSDKDKVKSSEEQEVYDETFDEENETIQDDVQVSSTAENIESLPLKSQDHLDVQSHEQSCIGESELEEENVILNNNLELTEGHDEIIEIQNPEEKIIIYRASEQAQVYPTTTNDDDSIGLTSVNLPLGLSDDAVKLLSDKDKVKSSEGYDEIFDEENETIRDDVEISSTAENIESLPLKSQDQLDVQSHEQSIVGESELEDETEIPNDNLELTEGPDENIEIQNPEEKEKIIIYQASEQTPVYPTTTKDDDSIGLTSVNLPLGLSDDAVKLLSDKDKVKSSEEQEGYEEIFDEENETIRDDVQVSSTAENIESLPLKSQDHLDVQSHEQSIDSELEENEILNDNLELTEDHDENIENQNAEEKEEIIIYRASEQAQVYPTNTNDDDSIGLTSVKLPLGISDDAVKLLSDKDKVKSSEGYDEIFDEENETIRDDVQVSSTAENIESLPLKSQDQLDVQSHEQSIVGESELQEGNEIPNDNLELTEGHDENIENQNAEEKEEIIIYRKSEQTEVYPTTTNDDDSIGLTSVKLPLEMSDVAVKLLSDKDKVKSSEEQKGCDETFDEENETIRDDVQVLSTAENIESLPLKSQDQLDVQSHEQSNDSELEEENEILNDNLELSEGHDENIEIQNAENEKDSFVDWCLKMVSLTAEDAAALAPTTTTTDKFIEPEQDVDTDDDKSQKLEDIIQEQQRVENEIRELEAMQNSSVADYLNALELQEKPPPPYSPSSSESLSCSSKSFPILLTDAKLGSLITAQVDEIWEHWYNTGKLLEVPNITNVSFLNDTQSTFEGDDENRKEFNDTIGAATSSFDNLLHDLIKETIGEALHVENFKDGMNFVDLVRNGPMGMEAMKQRIPKSKESLISIVYSSVVKTIPRSKLADDVLWVQPTGCSKWSCRGRDLVEEILVEEMMQEEPCWTECWPEELLVTEELYEKIVRDCLKDALNNFETAVGGDN